MCSNEVCGRSAMEETETPGDATVAHVHRDY